MADTISTSVSPFNFDTHAVRVVMCDDQPWFVATDVTDALGVDRTQSRRLDDDEKGVRLIHTPSGDQQMTVINESGLYSLILRSRKPEAKRFKKWVTSEVLPAIRKTGTYTVPTATISEAQCQHLQELVQLVVQSGKQTHGETWKRFHNKMKVASYRNLPAERFNDAVTYLKGKLDDETMLDLVAKHLAERMPAALEMAMVAASGVFTETVRQVLTAQDSPSMIRLMVGAQHVPGKGLQPMAHTVRHDQCLMSFNEMTKAVNEPGEMAASLSGMVSHEVRRALARMRDKKLVDREGVPNLWFAVEVDEATQPEPRPNVYEIPQYKPVYEAPARSDALDHTLVGSRRGDELVGFSVPKGIESIPVKSSAPVAEKKRSPINGSTFCKRIPIPVMVRP